jgi:hypothetical protein
VPNVSFQRKKITRNALSAEKNEVLPELLGEISLDDSRVKVEAAAVKEDIGFEPVPVAVAVSLLDEGLNLVVDAL